MGQTIAPQPKCPPVMVERKCVDCANHILVEEGVVTFKGPTPSRERCSPCERRWLEHAVKQFNESDFMRNNASD